MFVPRALRLKGARETKPKLPKPLANVSERSDDDALVDAMQGISTDSPAPQEGHIEPKTVARGPKFTVKPVTPEYLAQLAAGIELIFSDYAHQEEVRANWLHQRYRTIDGEENFVHLTAILEHPNISTLKPEATQVLLRQALQDNPSKILELSSSEYHMRRIPSSYPPKYLPQNSFKQVDDDGLSFWDQRTIYVEPHLRNLCQTPARVAHWLKEHGQLKQKWLPIQAVHVLYNSCAFVIFSGNVTHKDVWAKWRAVEKPINWKIMTKVEHTMRTAEYIALLEKQHPKSKGKIKLDDVALPAIARPAALALDVEVVPSYTEQPKKKRKRNRNKSDKANPQLDSLATNDDEDDDIAGEAQDAPRNKRRA